MNHLNTQWLEQQSFIIEVHVFVGQLRSADLAWVWQALAGLTMGLWIDSAPRSIHRCSSVVVQFLECGGTDPRTIFIEGQTFHTLRFM